MHFISRSPVPVLRQILYANPPAFISTFEFQKNYILWSTTSLPLTLIKMYYQTDTMLSYIKKNGSTHKAKSHYTAAMMYSVLKIFTTDPSVPVFFSPPLSFLAFLPSCPALF